MNVATVFSVSLVGLITYMYYNNKYSEVSYFTSKVDNREYLVQNFEDKQDAANLISRLVNRLDKLVNSLNERYTDKKSVVRLKERFNKDNVIENNSDNQYTSYSVNKGEQIIFCIRSRDENKKLVDLVNEKMKSIDCDMTFTYSDKEDIEKSLVKQVIIMIKNSSILLTSK